MEKKLAYILFFLGILFYNFNSSIAVAQDGEALFNAKCNTCHIMGKESTGPNLAGVKSRWEGEEEYLYEWVQNSPKVIAEGKSNRANEVKDYSATVMPIQVVTIDEAKAIIDYVDGWTPPAETKQETPSGEGEKVYVPDYEKNLTLFYVLITIIGFLLIAILIISKSTSAVVKSDLFKRKIAEIHEKNKSKSELNAVLIILFIGITSQASALTTEVPAMAIKENLWLYVENSELYILLIIALLLLGFLLHMVRMFYKFIHLMKPEEQLKKEAKKLLKERQKRRDSFTRSLTGAVPIEEEAKIDLGHDYDGIRELDNPMPPWWLAGFFISIVFAVVYMFHYHVLGTGDLQEVEYAKVMERENKKVQEYLKAQAMDIDENNATLLIDRADLRNGKALFLNNCAVCHTENGSGAVGPNLTDDYWIYGNDIRDIFKVIKKGAPNGMPEHQSKFNPIEIQQVASYVLNLEEVSEAQGGKEPQGELMTSDELKETTEEKLDTLQREELKDSTLLDESIE